MSERLSAAPSARRSRLIAWLLAATILVLLVALAVWQRSPVAHPIGKAEDKPVDVATTQSTVAATGKTR